MERSVETKVSEYVKKYKKKHIWRRVVAAMASVVLFCTASILVFPALTLEKDTYCGYEEKHGDACYKETKTLICGLHENGHIHSDSCYEEYKTLICGNEETEEHHHDENCYQTEKELVCNIPETEPHVHTDACYSIEKQLICNKPIHEHTLQCFSNPNADVEDESIWECTFSDVKLTEKWNEDVISIAETQLGYTESNNNYEVQEDGTTIKGYTRYGAWYGVPYGDWCAMFCSFCLHYAGVDEKLLPNNSNCENWIETLQKEEYDLFRPAGEYTPKPGDLIFFDWDDDGDSDHVGFVAELNTDEKENEIRITTIEGNSSDCVCKNKYDLSDKQILGFGEIPDKPLDEEELQTDNNEASEDIFVKFFECEDYTVKAEYKKDANIPEDAQLQVTQIPYGSDEYWQYYHQSVEAMLANSTANSEEELAISYMQFYDIGFYVNGEEIEPEGPVNITIVTREEIAIQDNETASAIHFGENGTEVLSVDTEAASNQEGESAFSFTQESFSVTGVVVSGTNYKAVTSVSNGDQVVVATWRDGTVYYLTGTNNNNGLLLTTNENNAKVWTVEYVGGIPRLKSGTNSYVTVQDNQAGLGNSYRGNLAYAANGNYWEIYCNNPDVYLNQHGGPTSTRAAGYSASGAADIGSRWVILKKDDSPTPADVPPVGSVTGVQTETLVPGEWYIIYGGDNGRALNAGNINSAEILTTYPTNGGTVTYYGNADVVWQWTGDGFRNRDGKYLRVGTDGPNNWLANYWIDDTPADSIYNAVYNSTYHIVYQSQDAWGLKYNKLYIHRWENVVQAVTETSMGPVQQSAEPIYLAQVTGNAQGPHDNHPRTSTTDTPDMKDLVIYNFDTTKGSIKGLAGVEYTLYDSNGNEIARYMTTDDYAVPIGRLIPGATYTIKQTSVPDGYVVVSQDKEFTVSNDGTAMIGAFYDYNNADYVPDKTAAVVDYMNRTYQVDLKVGQSLYDYSIDNTNFSLVVDQSNSMLFPAELTPTGKSVTFYRNGSGYNTHNSDELNRLGLDKNQTYYFISDENTSSTVYALFWDGSGWVFQDASYYAKAQNRADGCEHNIMDGANVPKFASSGSAYATGVNADGNGVMVHGGDINYSLNSIYEFYHNKAVQTDWNTYTLYTGSLYNRLHDLQQAMAMLCNTLSSMTTNATVHLETFDKAVETCRSYNLGADGSGVTQVIAAVNNIECAGGTRQDLAFSHLTGGNVGNNTGHSYNHLNTGKNEYVILVTDGAPSGASMNDVISAATTLKGDNRNATIVTAGLSLKNVKGGSQMLRDAATDYSWSYAADTAGALSDYMTQMLFRIAEKTSRNYQAKVIDEISDSFYPINPANNQALNDGTIIDLNGNVLTGYAANRAMSSGQYGTVKYDSATNTWYVEWNNQAVNSGNIWTGRIYLKTKEDFIGGNSIDTNKSANISLTRNNNLMVSTDLDTPTVNVRLLPMNEVSSEETVFLGDKVNIPDRIQALYDQLKFTKLVNNGDNVHNRSNASSTPGLNNDAFTPAYAWGRELTETDWEKLLNGETLTLPYTYDDASSHGAVGYFTVQLVKTGDGSSFDEHATTNTGNAVETYTLRIIYTPYKLGEGDGESVRNPNVHNGTRGPGNEVTEAEASTNIHKVNVVDGKITLIKNLTGKLKSDASQTYTFKLQRQVDGEFVDTGDPITVTVNANSTEGRVEIPNLPRGTYRVEEEIGDKAEFYMKEMSVVTGADNTNCYQNESSDTSCVFTIGEDSSGNDLIQYSATSGYNKVYSWLRDGYTGIEGVSYETLKVLNDKVAYTVDIPVEKVWSQADKEVYQNEQVYIALYQNDEPVVDENGYVWALNLNADNKWKGTFTVALDNKDDDVSLQGYSVRELDHVNAPYIGSQGLPAVVVNSTAKDQPEIVYYDGAVEKGFVHLNSAVYNVSTLMQTQNGVYSATVTNNAEAVYELPKTGSIGLYPIYMLGAFLIAGSLMFVCMMRRKHERKQRY